MSCLTVALYIGLFVVVAFGSLLFLIHGMIDSNGDSAWYYIVWSYNLAVSVFFSQYIYRDARNRGYL